MSAVRFDLGNSYCPLDKRTRYPLAIDVVYIFVQWSTGVTTDTGEGVYIFLVFRKKDLYLIITQKLTFHEIRRISWNPWNPADFRWNPWNPVDFRWNPVDFTQISPVKSTQNYKSKCFSKNSSVWWMQGGGFHPWNPVYFTCEIWWISPVKSTQNYKSKCFSKNSSVWWMQGRGYDQGFHEIHQISPMKSGRFHPDFTCEIYPNYKSKCFSKNSSVDECRVGLWPRDFMKSTRFHPEIWQIWPVKSSGFHPDITCEIHPKL